LLLPTRRRACAGCMAGVWSLRRCQVAPASVARCICKKAPGHLSFSSACWVRVRCCAGASAPARRARGRGGQPRAARADWPARARAAGGPGRSGGRGAERQSGQDGGGAARGARRGRAGRRPGDKERRVQPVDRCVGSTQPTRGRVKRRTPSRMRAHDCAYRPFVSTPCRSFAYYARAILAPVPHRCTLVQKACEQVAHGQLNMLVPWSVQLVKSTTHMSRFSMCGTRL